MAAGFFWDGYLHWARDIEAKDPEFSDIDDGVAPLFEPIFIRLNFPFETALIEDLLAFFSRRYPLLEPNERSSAIADLDDRVRFLANYAFDVIEPIIGLQHALIEQQPPEFFVYRPVARTQAEHDKDSFFFEILDVGAPARVNLNAEVFTPQFPAFAAKPDVFGAVIDNDIGFLNQNFRDPERQEESRFAAIWLQARERLVPDPSGFVRVHVGQVLDNAKINELLGQYGRDERLAYHELNKTLHSRAAFKLPPPIHAHGSMVTDLAFGNDRIGARTVPIFGVQLPPEAARDTSGTTSESYIVQGVRWICFWARELDLSVPLVVNISYGVLAGPKDGSKFLEAQIEKEIEIAGKYRDGSGNTQKVDVVLAYGNGRNERQVIDTDVAAGTHSEDITWLIPADNPVPVFIEIRAVQLNNGLTELPDTLTVSLIGPDSAPMELAGSKGTTTIEAEPPVTVNGGAAPARLYNVPRRAFSRRPYQTGYTLAAVGPTRAHGHKLPVAKAGDWKIRLTNKGASDVRIILQIQRGDTAPGFRNGGLQTRFEGQLIPKVEDGVAGQTVAPPQTNAGTNSAFANAAIFHTAGAGRDVFGAQVRASYSGEGADWTDAFGPDKLMTVDRAFTFGIRTSGTYSGTHARLSGTSAAAALRTRELIA
ncbi:hypothetical protein [uncultured Ruegeria sp.]|uniref:hypothetical protein n=1 Tax=uncultured Ruegeria sp. TaxID=259304 RepID=UPI002612FA46|nr:hypothetical protein [uncultured Ruegeria sp.]